jgi:hypothetical protein
VNRSCLARISKGWNLRDFHLARLQFSIFIDDIDFKRLDICNSPDYDLYMRSEAGAWVETADGKFQAYICFNSCIQQLKVPKSALSGIL